MPPPFEYRPAPWRTAGAGHRPWRAAVVKLSSRIGVQWLEPTPIEDAQDGDLTVSRAGTLDAAIVTPPTGKAFVVVSMYALWEKPHPTTGSSSWIYADGAVHRLISDISVFVGQQSGHRILAAGDLNILHGYGENGSVYWASRYATVFDRMRALGLSFVGPQAPAGRRAERTRGLTSSRVQATTSPRTTRITTGQPRPPGSSTSCLPPMVSLNSVRSARGTSRMPGDPVIIAKSTSSWPDQPASRGRRVRCAGRPSGDRALPSLSRPMAAVAGETAARESLIVGFWFDRHVPVPGFSNEDLEVVTDLQLVAWVLLKPNDKGVYQALATRPGRVLRHPLDSFAGDPEPHFVAAGVSRQPNKNCVSAGFLFGGQIRQGLRAAWPVIKSSFDDDRRPVSP